MGLHSNGRHERTRPPPSLTCRELVGLVTDYLEDALSPRDRVRFERHLSDCHGCAAYLDQMRQTLAVLGRLDENTLEPAVIESLLEAFRGWTENEAEGRARRCHPDRQRVEHERTGWVQ